MKCHHLNIEAVKPGEMVCKSCKAVLGPWKPGLPPGKYYDGMTDDFEVYFSPGGAKWHRTATRPKESADASQAVQGHEHV